MDLIKSFSKAGILLTVTAILAPFYFFILVVLYKWRRSIGPELLRLYSRICLLIFQVNIEQAENHPPLKKNEKGVLIISNHSSFLDIFVLSALFGSVFVSKAEVKYYPLVGQIAWLMGIIFLDRNSSNERLRLLGRIANNCSNRILVVFPQGTTSRITERLSFNRGIFKVVELNSDISLLPVTLHYRDDEEIAWNKPQSLKDNVIVVSTQNRIQVKVIIHNPVTIDHYRERSASEICKMVERTVLEPLHEKY